jgi:hypothetical protein
MVFHFVVAPSVLCDRFGAELLRERHADGFRFAVGVVGADGDPQAVGLVQQHELHLAARVRPRHLDLARGAERVGSDAIKDRRRLGRLDADLLELADVLPERRFVAAGPAGDHQLLEFAHLASAALAGSALCVGIGGTS